MKNKTHPNTTGMDKKPTTTSASHPTNPPPPRQATPQTQHEPPRNRPRPTVNQTPTGINQKPTCNPRDPLHKAKKPNPNCRSPTLAHLHPSPATQNEHTYQQPITKFGKKKKTETQICSCFNRFSVREISGGLFAVRDQL